jgi:hypothetical protein
VINCGCGFQVLHAVSCWLLLSVFTSAQDGHVASAAFSCLTLLQDSHVASAASLKCSTAVHTSTTSAEMVGTWLVLIYLGTSGTKISILYLATVGQFPELFCPSPGF